MDLSEARGLVLFRVVRGGIGITQRLGAMGTVSSTGHCHTHPRTRASPEPDRPPPERESPEMGRPRASPEMLKLLADLIVGRRNPLLSRREPVRVR